MRAEFLESVLDYQMFIGNLNESLYGIEKDLMVKEHKTIVKNESQEVFNEAVGDKVKNVITIIKNAIIKFKNWLVDKFKKIVKFVGEKLTYAFRRLEDVEDKVWGMVTIGEDISKSVTNYVKFIGKVQPAVEKVRNLNSRNLPKTVYLREKVYVDSTIKSLSDELSTLRAVNKKMKYDKGSVPDLKRVRGYLDEILKAIETISKNIIVNAQKMVASNASMNGNEWKDEDSVTFLMLTESAKQFNSLTSILTKLSSDVMATSGTIVLAINGVVKKKDREAI
jgi:hypothetical protein